MYVPDVDKLYARAIKAGCTTLYPLENQFWGDRFCGVRDPFGQEWALATHQEDVSAEAIGKRAKRAREQFQKMSEKTDALLKNSDSNSPQK
jgi:PhnB protein